MTAYKKIINQKKPLMWCLKMVHHSNNLSKESCQSLKEPVEQLCPLYRYGDQLNPWGDLIAMARAWCLLKPGKPINHDVHRK